MCLSRAHKRGRAVSRYHSLGPPVGGSAGGGEGGKKWPLREGEGRGVRAVRRSVCVWGVTSLCGLFHYLADLLLFSSFADLTEPHSPNGFPSILLWVRHQEHGPGWHPQGRSLKATRPLSLGS